MLSRLLEVYPAYSNCKEGTVLAMTSLFHNSSLFYRQIILLRIALYLSSSIASATASATTLGSSNGDSSGSGSGGSSATFPSSSLTLLGSNAASANAHAACCTDPFHRLVSTISGSGGCSSNGNSSNGSGNTIATEAAGSASHQIISLFVTFLNQPVLPTSLAITMSSVGSERRKKILQCIEIIMQMNEDYFQDFLQGDLLSSLSMILHSDGYDGKVEAGKYK